MKVQFADFAPYLLTTESSLEKLNSVLSYPVTMDRFRPNIVIGGVLEPYAEVCTEKYNNPSPPIFIMPTHPFMPHPHYPNTLLFPILQVHMPIHPVTPILNIPTHPLHPHPHLSTPPLPLLIFPLHPLPSILIIQIHPHLPHYLNTSPHSCHPNLHPQSHPHYPSTLHHPSSSVIQHSPSPTILVSSQHISHSHPCPNTHFHPFIQ